MATNWVQQSNPLGRTLGPVLLDQAGEFQTREMMQQLFEQTRYLYHH
jgi:hypothetical protein